MVCLLPDRHPQTHEVSVSVGDLSNVPFISSTQNGHTERVTHAVFRAYPVRLNIVMELITNDAICEFMKANFGGSLLNPLLAARYRDRLVTRPFAARTELDIF
ncbi:MAG: LysR substrate-binding domain-containing protein [Pseudomonadota bacterium]|nr:LysR substrate-binding domain-containing protein [Pseudomonadota bacterium]